MRTELPPPPPRQGTPCTLIRPRISWVLRANQRPSELDDEWQTRNASSSIPSSRERSFKATLPMADRSGYIIVTRDLTVSISPTIVKTAISVPLIPPPNAGDHFGCPVFVCGKIVGYPTEILRHSISEEMSHRIYKETGRKKVFRLEPEPAWLLALIWLIWEGVIQGLSWDVVKGALTNAISLLQKQAKAPSTATTSHESELYIRVGSLFSIYRRVKKCSSMGVPPSVQTSNPFSHEVPFISSIEYPPLFDERIPKLSDAEIQPKKRKPSPIKSTKAGIKKKPPKRAPKKKAN